MKNYFPGKYETILYAIMIALTVSIFNAAVFAQKTEINNHKITNTTETPDDFAADDNEIFILINAERARNGLNRLFWDEDLADIARDYSKKMADEDFFGHFDSNGQSVVERAKAAKLKHWSKIGENLFSIDGLDKFDGFTVEKWMESTMHRNNILDKDWTTTGIGIVKSASGEFFITQVFIKR
jgi:uncharacterized protein YkwD